MSGPISGVGAAPFKTPEEPKPTNSWAAYTLDIQLTFIKDISLLERLTQLPELDLSSTSTDNIAPLERLTQLTKLFLIGTHVKDTTSVKGLKNLKQLQIDVQKE